MKEWLDIKDLLWIIVGVVIFLVFLILWSIFRPKIKWYNREQRYCIVWEVLNDYEEIGMKDKRELELRYIKLPKWLNFLKEQDGY